VIRRYVPDDLPEINGWQEARGLPALDPKYLPEIGFIVPGVCAGFLNFGESGLVLIDWIVSNPRKSPEDRDNGLGELCVAFDEAGRGKRMLCWTHEYSVIERAKKHGGNLMGAYFVFERRG
jgi:hypothetical protein